MLLVIVTSPEKPPMLVMFRMMKLDEPGVSVTGPIGNIVVRENVGTSVKVAVCTCSGFGVGVPLATVTHVFATLVFVQPVWNPIVVPEAVPVRL
jgi:hypothetical protein